MRDYLVSLIRTYVPLLWGTALAWLVGVQVIDAETASGAGAFSAFLVTVAVGAFYALVRLAEPYADRVPGGRLLLTILMGSATAPAYQAKS